MLSSLPVSKHPLRRAGSPDTTTRRRPGRPPAGEGGEAVTAAYVQTTLRLPRETKRLLDTLTRLLGRKQREVMADALDLYAKRLGRADRETLKRLLARKG